MKKVLLALSAILLGSVTAKANARAQGWCEQGGQVVIISGTFAQSTQRFQRTFPQCTVRVYNTGTLTLATIYSNATGTPLANPFTADTLGHWYFYADNGRYDVQISNGGLLVPYTFGDIALLDPVNLPGTINAAQFSGADPCLKIQTAIATLPSIGGTVDARSFTGTVTCSDNPFDSTAKGVTLLLGNTTFITAVPWVIPNKSRLLGAGRGDPGSFNSVIQANAATFPTSTAVVQLCDVGQTPCFGVEAEQLAIDCNNVAGCIGGQNYYSQEESWFKNVIVTNNPGDGILVGYAAQNSGPYRYLEVLPESSGVADTTCFHVAVVMGIGVTGFRGIDGITCNGDGYSVIPTRAIWMEGVSPAVVSNVHVEHFTNGVVLGSATNGISDVVVSNISTGPDNATSVLIPSGVGKQNILISGVQNSTAASNVIVDQLNSISMSASTAGSGTYALGYGAAGQQTVFTTRKDVALNFQTSMNVLKSLTVPGTNTGADDGSFCFGVATPFCLFGHESNVGGVPGPVMKTQNLGMLIQNGQVTPGNVGGGLSLNGNGFNTDASAGQVGAGLSSDMGTFTARGTTAAFTQWLDGVINFYSNTGLTPGSTYTPTLRGSIKLNGRWDSITGFSTNGTAGVTCSGSPTSSFASVGGIVTHC